MVNASNGVIYLHSEVTIADIRDGTSNTYLLGEKHLNPDHYETGDARDDNHAAYQGADVDVNRWAGVSGGLDRVPVRDRGAGLDARQQFGSAHAAVWQAALCDGSVRALIYSIDPAIHARLAQRNDHQPIDGSAF